MRAAILSLIAMIVCQAVPAAARAEHARIELVVAGGGDQATANVDQTPPEWGKNPRPVLRVKANEPIQIRFLFTNVYPHKTLENVVIHLFVVRQGKVGQKELPDLKGDVVMETAFDMDFKPGGKAGQRSRIRLSEPGAYLVRVESRNTGSDHEHFAAIDLVVTRAP